MTEQAPAPAPETIALLKRAGWRTPDALTQPGLLATVTELLANVRADPLEGAIRALREHRRAEHAARESARAVAQVEKLQKLLEGLLDTQPMLCRLEGLHRNGRSRPQALCRIGNQLRHLTVHPEVALDELAELQPWDYVCVHPETMVVVGAYRDEDLFLRSQGEVVEFKGWQDRARGLVRIVRSGHEEGIVELCSALRTRALSPPAKLVLLRDDPRWAIAVLEDALATSRFEVDLAGITTRFEDLAGLDQVIAPLVEDSLLRLLEPELRRRFDLRPLRGLLLFSYKPGMGKTALVRAFARWLRELGEERGFDVVLYVVKPNELKSVWHGGDSERVRVDLCGSIRARQALPRARPLFQLVVLDEIDSLGRRAGPEGPMVVSGAHNDAVQALLAEMDGMVQEGSLEEARGAPPAHVLYVGMTNRPENLDEALKRPGRFGDHVAEMPDPSLEAAEGICAVHARSSELPWLLAGEVRTGLTQEQVRQHFLRPALVHVFEAVALRYASEGRPSLTEVTAGQLLAGVHYMEAVNAAKKSAARREFLDEGPPAITREDVLDALVQQVASAARQMAADPSMLARQLRIKGRVTQIEPVPEDELCAHRFLAQAGA